MVLGELGDLLGVAAGAQMLAAVLLFPGRDHRSTKALEFAFRLAGAHPAASPSPVIVLVGEVGHVPPLAEHLRPGMK